MFISQPSGLDVAPVESLRSGKAPSRESQSAVAAAGSKAASAPRAAKSRSIVYKGAGADAHCVAAEIVRALEARLPGRIRELRVDVHEDQFILHGACSTYYVKQVAGHLAMNAMEARLLARLVNEIDVHPTR
jgi:hypothetical protein